MKTCRATKNLSRNMSTKYGLTAATSMSLFISTDGWQTLTFMSATNKTKNYCWPTHKMSANMKRLTEKLVICFSSLILYLFTNIINWHAFSNACRILYPKLLIFQSVIQENSRYKYFTSLAAADVDAPGTAGLSDCCSWADSEVCGLCPLTFEESGCVNT